MRTRLETQPSRADSRRVSQQIPHILLKQNFHYRTHKICPLIPVLGRTHSAHSLTLIF